MDGISVNDINTSLSVEFNRHNVFKAGKGAGRSGSFFFFSHDKKFIVKTICKNELTKFLSILDSFVNHLEKLENKSLIARIYGIFTIKTNFFNEVHFMLMQNTCINT